MLCNEIIKKINESFPEERAMEWDNVGLLCGRDDKEVHRIYISLDATDFIIEDAIRWKADMLITHHPLIFSGIKKINDHDFVGRRLLKMIQHDMCYYAMHTNYDVCGMAELSGKTLGIGNAEVLEVTYTNGEREEGIGRVADLDEEMTLDELKQINIDFYVNLLRIKKAEQAENSELDYQILVQETKLQTLGISTLNLKKIIEP